MMFLMQYLHDTLELCRFLFNSSRDTSDVVYDKLTLYSII
jgi:hypothetical protein